MAMSGGIPEYAMQPARAPKTIEAKANYNTEKITCRVRTQNISFQIEEDILVPDIKPDMDEILTIAAEAGISPEEKSLMAGEELVNLTGNIHLQAVYKGNGGEIVPLEARLPYKHQWKSIMEVQADATFQSNVKALEYIVVNERKLRIKVTMEVSISFCTDITLKILCGLEDGQLQLKKEPVSINCMTVICKDETDITESFKRKDGIVPKTVLREDYHISENYRQITGDKIVINGFIFITLLYLGANEKDAEEKPQICQQREKIEFTQFIPIGRNFRDRNYTLSQVEFHSNNMHTEIVSPLRSDDEEELSHQKEFQCSGSIETKVYLYEPVEKTMVVDAYHQEKNFGFEQKTSSVRPLSKVSDMEIDFSDGINLKSAPLTGRKSEASLFGYCTVEKLEASFEQGRGTVEGTLMWNVCYMDKNEEVISLSERKSLHHSFQWEEGIDDNEYKCEIKSVAVDFINDSQVEVKCQLALHVAGYGEIEFMELTNPTFEEGYNVKSYPMVIVSVEPGESLWDIAKRHRTTEKAIKVTNNLEDMPKPYSRLLIMK